MNQSVYGGAVHSGLRSYQRPLPIHGLVRIMSPKPHHRRPMSRMSLLQLRLSGGISICLILCCAVQPPRGGSAYDCLGGDSITLFMCAHASRSRGCVVVNVLVRMSPRVSTEHEVPAQSSSGPERPSCEVGE